MKLAASCLQLDVGNSSAKWRLLRDGVVAARGSYVPGDPDSERELVECAAQLQQIWVSSVASAEADGRLAALLEGRWRVRPWFARSAARTGDLHNSYAEPGRLGVDRWLAMLGARQRLSGRLVVVDAGSALTIDLVAADGRHEGGFIVPGPVLMERALLLDTDRVRFAEPAQYDLTPGTSTAEAVRHGIAVAQVGALRTVLDREGVDEPQRVVFCGGGGQVLMELAGVAGMWAPDLVFEGLAVMASHAGPGSA
jgi:type III pantothenate kinase